MRRPQTVRVRGRLDKVLDEIVVNRRPYYLLERLGRRDIFRVFDPTAGVHGDYRVLHLLADAQATRQRLEVLRRLAASNLNLPTILEIAKMQRGQLAVVSAWAWGVTLRDYLTDVRTRRQPRPSTREACRLIRGLAHGLSHFHHKLNLVHGDIKPANIVLSNSPKHLILIDFGSAWPVERTRRKEAGDGISAPYAAPEQMGDATLPDFRSDIFSLSVVWYELLTLAIPYDGCGGQAGLPAYRAAFTEKNRPPSTLLHDAAHLPAAIPVQLDRLLQRGLALHPNDRFGGRTEWLGALDELHFQFRRSGRLGIWGKIFLGVVERLRGWWRPQKRR